MWRSDPVWLAYAAVLLIVHVVATRGTGSLPVALQHAVGASAETVLSRPWAQFTAQWFHGSWGHLGYNLAILVATMPLAVHALGGRTVLLMVLASALVGYAIDLLLILPLSGVWAHAAAAAPTRLVGASVAIFAGAGMAWHAWQAAGIKAAAAVVFVGYEVVLAVAGVTQPFVWAFHIGGGVAGAGMAAALTR